MSDASSVRRPPAACSIITRNYLSHARVLARSWAEYEPGGRFYLLVVDGLPEGTDAGPSVRVLGLDDLDIPALADLAFTYGAAELCSVAKPSLLRFLLDRCDEERILYFDADILITRPLVEVRGALAGASIVLTPNLLKPIPLDGLRPRDQDILCGGTFNLGFLAVRRSAETHEFVRWWEERLRDYVSVIDVPEWVLTDQKWADLVPGLFPETAILRDDAYNVAWWNLHHRTMRRRNGQFLVNGRPLAFFHFSGFDPVRPHVLTQEFQNRIPVQRGTALALLLEGYARLQMEQGYAETSAWDYGYAGLEGGPAAGVLLRRLYQSQGARARGEFAGTSRRNGTIPFLDWATRPRPENGNLSPFLQMIYRMREDVAAAFPDADGEHRAAFLRWARNDGAREMGYDPDFMRIGAAAEQETTALV